MGARYGLRQIGEGRSGRRQQNELSARADRQGVREAAYDELSTLEQSTATNEIIAIPVALSEARRLECPGRYSPSGAPGSSAAAQPRSMMNSRRCMRPPDDRPPLSGPG